MMKTNKENYQSLYKVAKKLMKKRYAQLKKLKDKKERTETLKYVLTSYLKLKKLEVETKALQKGKENHLFLEKLKVVDPKIKYFEVTMKKKDYDSVLKTLEEVEKDV